MKNIYFFLILLSFKYVKASTQCYALFEQCYNTTVCWNSVGQQYNNTCSPVWDPNSTYTSCPTGCKDALADYIAYFDPNHEETAFTFCNCTGDTNCDVVRQKYLDIGCLDQDCRDLDRNNSQFRNYFNICYPIINDSWNQDFCPTGCQMALQEYVNYVAPNYSTISFCSCNGNANCQRIVDEYTRVGCATESCDDVFEDCTNDANCEPLAQAYKDSCDIIFNGSWHNGWCPEDCEENLMAWLNYVAPNLTDFSGFCECDGSNEANCNKIRQQLYDVGCIGESCVHLFYDCTLDTECNVIATKYYSECEMILNGSWTYNWCPYDCSYWLWKYISYVAPNSTTVDFCDCYTNEDCSMAKQNLINAGCVNDDCTQVLVECENDSKCSPYASMYNTKCQAVINGSWTGNTCPNGCSEAIYAYINATESGSIASQYCDCNGNIECINIMTNFYNLGCIVNGCEQTFYDCTQNPNCSATAITYYNDCQSVINGSWTSGDPCPTNCTESLTAYIRKVWGASNANDLSDYCDCGYNTNCLRVLQQLNESTCYIPSSESYKISSFNVLLSIIIYVSYQIFFS